eukprot:11704018-Heterocapsa_arctica.AAC.1
MEVLAREEEEEEKQRRIDQRKNAKNKHIKKRPAQQATDTTIQKVESKRGKDVQTQKDLLNNRRKQ